MNRFEKLVIWSEALESIIHGVELKQHEKTLGALSVCAREILGIPNGELDFSSFRRWSICSLLKELDFDSLIVALALGFER